MKTEKKSGAERTQPAVHDEWWSDDRVKSFLLMEPTATETPDFHVLLRAYQGMVPEAFARFVGFFTAAGRNLNQRNRQGQTILAVISRHRNGKPYADILQQAGAGL
jgi:hypothetical protein